MMQSPTIYNVAVTVAILSAGLNVGLFLGLLGPTIPDLALLTGVSLTTASTLTTWQAITYIFGSLLSGPLLQNIDTYMVLSIALLLQGITTALSGCFSSFALVAFFQAAANLFTTIMMTGIPLLVFQQEQSSARRLAQAIMVLLNVGKTVIPFIAAPFLAPGNATAAGSVVMTPNPRTTETTELWSLSSTDNTPNTTVLVTNLMTPKTSSSPVTAAYQVTRVGWVYAIVGGFYLLMFFLYAAIAFANGCKWRAKWDHKPPRDEKGESVHLNPEQSKAKIIFIITLFMLAIFIQSGMEYVENTLLLSFILEYLHRPKTEGLILTAVYQGVMVFICFGMIFLVNRVHPSTILIADISCMVIATSGMFIAVITGSEPTFYIGTVILSIGMSNYYATILSWVKDCCPISGWLSMLVSLSFGLSAMVLPPLTMVLLSSVGAIAFPVVLLVSALLCGVVWGSLKYVLKEPLCAPATQKEPEERTTETSSLLSDTDEINHHQSTPNT